MHICVNLAHVCTLDAFRWKFPFPNEKYDLALFLSFPSFTLLHACVLTGFSLVFESAMRRWFVPQFTDLSLTFWSALNFWNTLHCRDNVFWCNDEDSSEYLSGNSFSCQRLGPLVSFELQPQWPRLISACAWTLTRSRAIHSCCSPLKNVCSAQRRDTHV